MPILKAPASPQPPKASRKSYEKTYHGHTRHDSYFWLKDPHYPDVQDEQVLAYLKEENAYFSEIMDEHKGGIEALFEEIKSRIKEDDNGVPWQDGDFEYRWKFNKGEQYRIWFWRARSDDPFIGDDWNILFDENEHAKGLEFFKLATLEVSPDGKWLAWSSDTNGSERFTIRIKNLETGEVLPEEILETSGELVWDSNSQGFAYVIVSKEWRPYLVKYHALGTEIDADKVIYEETEGGFFTHIGQTSSRKYMVIRSGDHVTSESRVVEQANLTSDCALLSSKRTEHDYFVDHGAYGDAGETCFYIRSNRDHENFGIYVAAEDARDEADWQKLLIGSDSRYIRDHQVFARFLLVDERVDGLDQIGVRLQDGSYSHIPFGEAVYEASSGGNAEYDQAFVRIQFSSMITPPTVFDFGVDDQKLTVRKRQEIPSGYEVDDYASERLMITARDGSKIPVSIVYKKDWHKDAGKPLHLYGYGAYGLGMSPAFSSARLSLLDRGFAYAIAHIRGGDELGFGWYRSGKLEQRTNTFNDFVDVARALTDQGYAAKGGISISGGSAGGELMGAVVNQAPGLFAAAVLHVPFVDVLNTMLDADLPLTPMEWPEWGNPIEDEGAYQHILSYCPYTNIEAKAYPPMMVTGGLNDPRVTYWEPAKWTAKLRATKTDDNLLVMKINMGAGHGGKSGRFERLRETAEEYMFVLSAFGLSA